MTDADPYLDAADRLERVIDEQVTRLDSVETKAEHVTRPMSL